MSQAADQRGITAWFDTIYSRRGSGYVRPLRAYRVFPALVSLTARDRLLDVACGPGMMLQAAGEHTRRLHGCDISRVAVAQARSKAPHASLLVANAEVLPYPAGMFDVVTCLGSLERMLDRPRVLDEFLRVGTARARYCIQVRNANTVRWKYLSSRLARRPEHGHMDADTVENWMLLFQSAGFMVRRVLPDQYPLLRRQLWRRLRLGTAHFCREAASRKPLERANGFVFIMEKQT